MKEPMLLSQMKFWRSRTLTSLSATSENHLDEIPNGFSNSIRWNFGHILFSQEALIQLGTGRSNSLPEPYKHLFAGGTKPSDWNEVPPSLTELKEKLEKQTDALTAYLSGNLENKLLEPIKIGPILEMSTVAELVNFTIQHEVLHLGTINGIKRALGVKNLWEPEN